MIMEDHLFLRGVSKICDDWTALQISLEEYGIYRGDIANVYYD